MSTNVRVVNLEGDVSVSSVDRFVSEIREGFKEKNTVLVSLSSTTSIDLAGIQMIYAARRYADRNGRAFHITGTVPEPIAHKFLAGGFTERLLRDGKELDAGLHGFSAETSNDA